MESSLPNKICSICKIEKEFEQFAKCSKTKSGKRAKCKACANLYNASYRANNLDKIQKHRHDTKETTNKYFSLKREEAVKICKDYFLKNPCVECGEKNPVVLEFDHLINNKKFSVGARKRNYKSLHQEIIKCQVLCVSCHRLKTAKEQSWYSWMGVTAAEDDLGSIDTYRQRTHRRRLYDFKCANPCVDCGEENPILLDFDHVRGKKKLSVARMVNSSWDKIVTEAAKCEVRCCKCHRIKTIERISSLKIQEGDVFGVLASDY